MGYSVKADSVEIFGSQNIDKWADLNNEEIDSEISDRITWAIQEAYNEINSRLYGCRYTVPFELVSSVYDPIIINLSARLVGVILYDNRQLVDSPEYDEVAYHRKKVEMVYKQIHGGQLSLLLYETKAKNYPQAIASESS